MESDTQKLQHASDHSDGLPPLELDADVLAYLKQSLYNDELGVEDYHEKFQQLLCYLGTPPLYTTLRVNTLTTTVEETQEKLKAILTEKYAEKNWPSPEVTVHPVIHDMLIIPSQGPYQSNKVEHEVMVDLQCGMAVLRGADIYVHGVLAATGGVQAGTEVSVYVDIDRRCSKGSIKPYTGRRSFVGNGKSLYSRKQIFTAQDTLSGVGVMMMKPLYRAPSLSDLLPDLVQSQNLPSIVCSHVLDPQPGECILDMCAAPGGKTSHIAALMKNQGRVVALDKSSRKIPRIVSSCQRQGLDCVEAHGFDGTKCVGENTVLDGGPPYPPESFDRVLLDAPCSALGKRPAMKNPISLAELASYPPLQRKLFHKAVELLIPGGTLVYSTCTIPTDENESMVAWALKKFPQLSLTQQNPHLGGPGWPHPDLSDIQIKLLQRFIHNTYSERNAEHCSSETSCGRSCSFNSGHTVDSDTIGFFIAKFTKCR